MALEIERKYLLNSDKWRSLVVSSHPILQGYLNAQAERTVRVRIKGDEAFLTVKGKNEGIARVEFEYSIPLLDAKQMLGFCETSISKTRHLIHESGLIWEIDEFDGVNKGLILAEVELSSEFQMIQVPEWIGKEVSGDMRYYNSNLISNPYMSW